jgi:hypothetical protein
MGTNGEIADLAAAGETVPGKEKAQRQQGFPGVERTGIEPVTSGLQTHPVARLHLTPTDRVGMAEPKSPVLSNANRHRSTKLCSHRARTAAA